MDAEWGHGASNLSDDEMWHIFGFSLCVYRIKGVDKDGGSQEEALSTPPALMGHRPWLQDVRLGRGTRLGRGARRRRELTHSQDIIADWSGEITQTSEASHPSLDTFAGFGGRLGVPCRWGCLHLQIFPPFLASVYCHKWWWWKVIL